MYELDKFGTIILEKVECDFTGRDAKCIVEERRKEEEKSDEFI